MKMPNVTKILNNKMIQTLGGAYFNIAAQAAQSGLTSMQVLENIINGATTTPHIPSLPHVLNDLTGGMSRPILEQFLKMYLIGWGLKETGISPKWGNLAKNFAKNAAKGVAIASIITHATIWNSPGPDANSYNRITNNFMKAPLASSYNYE
jgi:hypothetical protein